MTSITSLKQQVGRKKLPDTQKRKHHVAMYLSTVELEYLEDMGKDFGLSASKVLRLLLERNNLLPQS